MQNLVPAVGPHVREEACGQAEPAADRYDHTWYRKTTRKLVHLIGRFSKLFFSTNESSNAERCVHGKNLDEPFPKSPFSFYLPLLFWSWSALNLVPQGVRFLTCYTIDGTIFAHRVRK